MDKPPSNSPTDRGHSGVCAETVRLDDDGDAVTDEALDGRGRRHKQLGSQVLDLFSSSILLT